ncbi:hypothetical protein BGZ65_011103, partial [Modicella reniformis]
CAVWLLTSRTAKRHAQQEQQPLRVPLAHGARKATVTPARVTFFNLVYGMSRGDIFLSGAAYENIIDLHK